MMLPEAALALTTRVTSSRVPQASSASTAAVRRVDQFEQITAIAAAHHPAALGRRQYIPDRLVQMRQITQGLAGGGTHPDHARESRPTRAAVPPVGFLGGIRATSPADSFVDNNKPP
ncbi:MAG: hypothetical protein PHU07_07750 [Acidocella sp.]|nr:hypothetical protein [Acidocella sp.]